VANNRAANTETLKILTLPKEAPSKTETQIASKLAQYQLLLHIYLCFMFLYISMSCPFLSIFIYRS
jgi:hypothetical protein